MSQIDPFYNSNNYTISDEYSTAEASARIDHGIMTIRATQSLQFTNGTISNMKNSTVMLGQNTTSSIVQGIVDISYTYYDISHNYFDVSHVFINTATQTFDTGYTSIASTLVPLTSGSLTVHSGRINPTTHLLFVDTGVLDASFIVYDISHNYFDVSHVFINTATQTFDTGYTSIASTLVPLTSGSLTVHSGRINPTTHLLFVDTGVLDASFIVYDISHNYTTITNGFFDLSNNVPYHHFDIISIQKNCWYNKVQTIWCSGKYFRSVFSVS